MLFSGSAKVNATITGSILAEQKTNDDAVENVITFSANVLAIEIFHNELTWQEFIVNGITITVPPGGWDRQLGGAPSTDVTVPTGISCIVGRLV